MPYPAASEHPASTPCVKKFRGSSVGVREAAKNSVPKRRPQVENECHSPLSMRRHLSIPSERSFVRQLVAQVGVQKDANGSTDILQTKSTRGQVEPVSHPELQPRRPFRRAECHARYRFDANKMVAH